MVRNYLIFLIFFLSFYYLALSQEIDYYNTYNSKFIFYGDDIIIKINNCTPKLITIERSDGTKQFITNPSTEIKLSLSDYKTQKFNIIVNCEENNTIIEKEIFTNKLDFEVLEIQDNYLNEFTKIKLLIRMNDRILDISNFSLSFSFTQDFKLESDNNYYYLTFFANKIFDNIAKISLRHELSEREFEKTFRLSILHPLKLLIYFDDKKVYFPNSNVTIQLEAFYKDEKLYLSNVSLFAIYGSNQLSNFYECGDKICIDLQLGEDSSWITFVLKYNGYEIKNFTYVKIGKIGTTNFFDLDSNPLSIEMIIDNERYLLKGQQTFLFLPGIKNITLRIQNLEINLINVKLENFEDSIRIYPISINEKNLKILSFYAFQTNLEFEKALAKIYYNERSVVNEQRIIAIQCTDFSLNDKVCKEYKKLDSERNMVSNYLTFEIPSNSFFGILEKKQLKTQYSLNKNEFYFNENIIIRGIVFDEESKNQESEIVLKFLDRSYKTKTKNSVYEFVISSPNIEGNYKIEIYSNNEFFDNFNESIQISVIPKADLIIIPNSLRVSANQSYAFLTIKNVGQVNLKNIKITSDKTIVDPNYFNEISVNEEKTIKLLGFLRNSNPEILKFRIETDRKTFEFEIPVYYDIIQEQQNVTQTSIPTGQFLALPQINLNLSNELIWSVIISVMIILFSILYSKKSKRESLYGKTFLKRKFR
ncbi:MAG: hypothetical protein QW197_01295 [Candidatus Aenigmatarchaeota archaeon]